MILPLSARLRHADRRGVPDARGRGGTDGQLAAINAVLTDCVRRGQSIRNVMANNPDLFPFCERTMYNYVGLKVFDAVRGDLPFACSRRPRKSRPQTKTDAKCRVGRAQPDLLSYRLANPDTVGHEAEMDGLEGQKADGRYMFTYIFNDTGLALGVIRDGKTSADCRAVFDTLWEAAGPALFRKIFRVIITDNGPEFSDPGMIENWRPDPGHNPTKLLPRGVRVWFADPCCSSQKPHIERFHNELRRILQKGTSFDPLTQEQIALALSHLNSYPRESLGWRTPYDVFVERHGEEGRAFLAKLGIVRIPENQVTLHPFLLGAKFQKAADRAILRKNGVAPAQKPELKK